ncbi:MAG: tRNA (N6-threonylcarbamoyladenosine(37)-N6)-methyltransferase TrmO [Pseudonocardiaceae bacterium]|nr:tRNA (N6-threonylcarbamoyladenosine(37)-N6)-methyltransferase TrmO [Pseudonocardiaceae bacterium]
MTEPDDLDEAERERLRATDVVLRPVGYVIGPRTRPEDTPIQSLRNPDEQGSVVIFPEFAAGLDGLAGFDYVWLLAHLADAPAQPQLQVVPFLLRDRGQRMGVFATRHPARPNRLALSVVRLLAVEGTVLRFAGLDLCHQTPIVDIKPWEQHLDIPGYRPGNPELDGINGGWYQSSGAATRDQRFPEPGRWE